jgi:hypothetical protein
MKVDSVTIKVSYYKTLEDIDIPEETVKELEKMEENLNVTDLEFYKYPKAVDFINDSIKERDAIDIEYEVEEVLYD